MASSAADGALLDLVAIEGTAIQGYTGWANRMTHSAARFAAVLALIVTIACSGGSTPAPTAPTPTPTATPTPSPHAANEPSSEPAPTPTSAPTRGVRDFLDVIDCGLLAIWATDRSQEKYAVYIVDVSEEHYITLEPDVRECAGYAEMSNGTYADIEMWA